MRSGMFGPFQERRRGGGGIKYVPRRDSGVSRGSSHPIRVAMPAAVYAGHKERKQRRPMLDIRQDRS